jgi:hypothetical protein
MINEIKIEGVMHTRNTFAGTYETPMKEMDPKFHPNRHMIVGEATLPLEVWKVRHLRDSLCFAR